MRRALSASRPRSGTILAADGGGAVPISARHARDQLAGRDERVLKRAAMRAEGVAIRVGPADRRRSATPGHRLEGWPSGLRQRS